VPQDHTLATRAPKLSREIALIDFNQSAAMGSARVRGLSPWPGVQVQLAPPPSAQGKPRIVATILKCQASSSNQVHSPEERGMILLDKTVACAVGSIELLIVQPQGKKPMDLAAFANGYSYAPGARFGSLIPVPPKREA